MKPRGCGTNAGYQAHIVAGTETCEACRAARRAYAKSYRSRPARRIVEAATERLRATYQAEYERFLVEEIARLEGRATQ